MEAHKSRPVGTGGQARVSCHDDVAHSAVSADCDGRDTAQLRPAETPGPAISAATVAPRNAMERYSAQCSDQERCLPISGRVETEPVGRSGPALALWRPGPDVNVLVVGARPLCRLRGSRSAESAECATASRREDCSGRLGRTLDDQCVHADEPMRFRQPAVLGKWIARDEDPAFVTSVSAFHHQVNFEPMRVGNVSNSPIEPYTVSRTWHLRIVGSVFHGHAYRTKHKVNAEPYIGSQDICRTVSSAAFIDRHGHSSLHHEQTGCPLDRSISRWVPITSWASPQSITSNPSVRRSLPRSTLWMRDAQYGSHYAGHNACRVVGQGVGHGVGQAGGQR